MYEQVEKPKENKSRAVANSVARKKSNVKQGIGFVDNRPRTVAQMNVRKQISNKFAWQAAATMKEKQSLLNEGETIQCYATLEDVKKTGEKILGHKVELVNEGSEEETKIPTQKMVMQRLINAPISLGNPYEFQVEPGDIGTGTATTPGTRAFVNGPGAPLAPTATFSYGFFPGGGGWIPGAAPGPLNIAPNPPPVGGNYDAGHALGRQNGGLGHVNNWVFPQDRNVNRGWAGTFPQWRAHENAFRAGVTALGPGGFGVWRVTLP